MAERVMRGPSERGRLVITIIWDGLRPDFVDPAVTPTLHRLVAGGVWFDASYCAYPSETRVNAAALATGCAPGRTGITGNTLFVAGFDAERPAQTVNTGDHTQLARIAQLDPPLVRVPCVADAIAAAGGVMTVASSGSPGAALLQNPRSDGITFNYALVRPPWLAEQALDRFGPPPAAARPATARSDWITRGLLDLLLPEVVAPALRDGLPALVHWWLTDPDNTAHYYGLGAPETLQSLRENDRRLAALHERLDDLNLTSQTDVLLTSDHGFTTAGPPSGFDQALVAAGLRESLDSDDVVTTGQSGGSVFLHQRARHRAAAIVAWLQHQPWVGPIFARDGGPAAGLPGTLPISAVWNGHVDRRAPDVKFGVGWTDAVNQAGVPGTVLAGSGRGASHGSASPFDMRNSLVAWGPSFKPGVRSPVPAGILDVAPTVRRLLGLHPGDHDGRVLEEALADGPDPASIETIADTLEARSIWPGGGYHQRLTLRRVAGATYVHGAENTHT
jgi:arylsulfatase A-like enzyme